MTAHDLALATWHLRGVILFCAFCTWLYIHCCRTVAKWDAQRAAEHAEHAPEVEIDPLGKWVRR